MRSVILNQWRAFDGSDISSFSDSTTVTGYLRLMELVTKRVIVAVALMKFGVNNGGSSGTDS